MKVRTLGHASLLLSDNDNNPILLTDPWLVGSCYWRSWWLQNYPSSEDWDKINDVKYCYITHEHPDHFHTPSIRKIGNGPKYLSPRLPEEKITTFLKSQGKDSSVLEALKWYRLTDDFSVLSIPLYNDDSCLLIDTPEALILNLNDAKPTKRQLKRVRKFAEKENTQMKKLIVLNSYSPASLVNSFRKDGKVVSIKEKDVYVKYLHDVMETLGADYFIPFASQAIFYRPDSKWANEYKVSIEDIESRWTSNTKLVYPYSEIDLQSFVVTTLPEKDYIHSKDTIEEKVSSRMKEEDHVVLDSEHVENLRKKLNSHRFLFSTLFRKGIGFITEKQKFIYHPIKGKITEVLDDDDKKMGSFAIRLPASALIDAVTYGHFGDLGITMFTIIILNESVRPQLIYLFFIILTLHDYGHTQKLSNFFNWITQSIRLWRWSIPELNSAKIATISS